MTTTLLATASAQTTELQLGTTLALSSAQRSSATCLQHPCAPLHTVHSTLFASLLSSELRSATCPAADLGSQFWAQQPAGAQAGAEATAAWPGCTLVVRGCTMHKGQKDTQYIPASSTRSSKYMAAAEDHLKGSWDAALI